jgi:hypothetical protein
MTLQKITFQPGVYKDDSPLEAQGYWIDADKIRFVRGLPETIYGWEHASNSTLLGICRGAITWADNVRNPFAGFGTHLRLYVMDVDGNVSDITPVASRGTLTDPFTTTDGASTTVTHAGHGLIAGQKTKFENAAAVGGITVSGEYVVESVTDADNYIITTAAATADGPGGGTVYFEYFLAPGQTDGLGGLGYGTGGFGTGGYGGSASGYTLYPRSWSLAQWGQNLIANPRGGKIYEWAPNVSATELVTNGSFTGSAGGWTTGAGWAYGTDNVVATAASAALSQSIILPAGAWCRLETNVTAYTSGSIQPSLGGTDIGEAINATGLDRRTFFTGGGGTQTLAMTGLSASLTCDDISVEVLTTAEVITNAPTQVTCIFTTAERILVACGCPDTNGNFDAMRVRWSDTQNNQTWTAAASNLAGSFALTNGSRIVRGMPGNRENLVLTDTAAYAMRFVPDPNVVFSFAEIGSGCGLIGPNAMTQVAGRFFWMSSSGEFYVYDGSYPQPLQSTVKRDVNDHLSWVQQDKVYAFSVASRNEVWWLYPDIRDGNECSRYVIYNYIENHWSIGTFNRTAWIDAGVFQYPLAVDDLGFIWFHEKGFTEDGGVRSWRLQSAYFDIANGDSHMRIGSLQPDAEDQQGGYGVSLDANIRNGDGVLTRTFGPYNVTNTTGKISMRVNGEEVRLTLAGSSAPAFWRMGAMRFDLQDTGRKR